MLPKARRIPKADFLGILKQGKRLNSPHFLLYMAQNKDKIPTRVSFSVSKKVAKNAVDRNTLRRRGYSAIKSFLNGVKGGYFLYFSFKSKDVSFEQINKEIKELLSASGVLL
jgi:ribonuclease P protein component